MNNLVLIGGGGHCKVVIDSIDINEYDDIVILDPQYPILKEVSNIKVVGDDDDLENLYKKGYTNAFITLGSISDTSLRMKLYENAKKLKYHFVNIIDSTSIIADNVKLSEGIYIGKNAVINSDASIGKMCIINTSSVIEHECIIEEFTHISIGSILCGNVHVGKNSFIGANSTIKNNIYIGDYTVVGMSSCVLKDVLPNSIVVGNPLKNIGGKNE